MYTYNRYLIQRVHNSPISSKLLSAMAPFIFFQCVFTLMISITAAALQPPLAPALYVFGDSLLDSGNNNLLPTIARANFLPYGANFPKGNTGRFTNGKTVADFVGIYIHSYKFFKNQLSDI